METQKTTLLHGARSPLKDSEILRVFRGHGTKELMFNSLMIKDMKFKRNKVNLLTFLREDYLHLQQTVLKKFYAMSDNESLRNFKFPDDMKAVVQFQQMGWPDVNEVDSEGRIRILYLYKRKLKGRIPRELGYLNQLVELNLSANEELNGSIPRELGLLNQLTYLNLQGNKLSGTIPPELADMPNLRYLELSNNYLEGSIPSKFIDNMNLKSLTVHINHLINVENFKTDLRDKEHKMIFKGSPQRDPTDTIKNIKSKKGKKGKKGK